MEGIADYKRGAENNTADKHGLEVGDVVDTGWETVEVVEIDADGVRFDNGDTADHLTVACNLADVRSNQEADA